MTDYTATGKPLQGSRGISKQIRDEFESIETAINSKANIASPALTGTPTAPTPTLGDSSTTLATTAFVAGTAFSSALPAQLGNADKGIITDGTNASWSSRFALQDKANVFTESQTMNESFNTSRASVTAHATTADIWGAAGNEIDFTGAVTVTDFPDAPQAGASRVLYFDGVCVLTNNANISLPGGNNYETRTGDVAIVSAVTVSTFKVSIINSGGVTRIRPIFDNSTALMTPISSYENLTANTYDAGLSGVVSTIYGNSIWVAFAPNNIQANVATSTDGEIWTLRAMTSSARWSVGYDGTNFLAIDLGGLDVVKSSNGTSWSDATDVTVTSFYDAPQNAPVSLQTGEFVAQSTTKSQVWKTANTGTSWATYTLPADCNSFCIFVVGSVYWYWATGTSAYTSTTAETSSWTSRTLPDTPLAGEYIWQNPDGSLMFQTAASGDVYETSDGITWSQVSGYIGAASSKRVVKIDGVYANINGSSTTTMHGSLISQRTSTIGDLSYFQARVNDDGNGTVIISANASADIAVIDDTINGAFY